MPFCEREFLRMHSFKQSRVDSRLPICPLPLVKGCIQYSTVDKVHLESPCSQLSPVLRPPNDREQNKTNKNTSKQELFESNIPSCCYELKVVLAIV
jgi:hypothetical protein